MPLSQVFMRLPCGLGHAPADRLQFMQATELDVR